MDDKSMAAQEAVANQAALEAQASSIGAIHSAGGNALLDAEAEAGTEIESPPVEHPIATDFTADRDRDDSTEAKVFTTTGDYPVDFEQLNDEGNLSLVSDTPSAE